MANKNIVDIPVDEKSDVAVVVVPFPAQGHLNPLLHLSNLIVSAYSLPVHFVGTPSHNRQAQVRLHGWDPKSTSKIHFHDFPTPSFPTPPPKPNTSDKIPVQLFPSFHATMHLREPICELVKKLSATLRRVIVVHDSLMTYVIQDVPSIPNAESYCFQSVSAFTMYTYYCEMAGKLVLADGEPVNDLLQRSALATFPKELVEFLTLQTESKKQNWGNLYNTSRVIDGDFLDLIAQAEPFTAEKHWAVGPFNPLVGITPNDKRSEKHHKCLEWLDKQAANSVILVSFGSTISLCDGQVKEIAMGLENSGVKFIWVLRDADRADIFMEEIRRAELPEGYEERITNGLGRGIIVRDWAPQLEILGHSSTGGFMTHCGWNSCIESISLGVPMAAWPMHSDQPRNVILVTKVLKIGMRVGEWGHEGELVKADEVGKIVKRLMDSDEGQEMRKRAAELSDAIKKSVDKNGSGVNGESCTEMDAFINHIIR